MAADLPSKSPGSASPHCVTAKQQQHGQTHPAQPVLLPTAPKPSGKLGRLPGAQFGSTAFGWAALGGCFPQVWCCRIRGLILYRVGNKPARVYSCLPLFSQSPRGFFLPMEPPAFAPFFCTLHLGSSQHSELSLPSKNRAFPGELRLPRNTQLVFSSPCYWKTQPRGDSLDNCCLQRWWQWWCPSLQLLGSWWCPQLGDSRGPKAADSQGREQSTAQWVSPEM